LYELIGWKAARWQNRNHFFAVSAQLMRRILVDHARTSDAQKRGGGADRVTFKTSILTGKSKRHDLIELDEALTRLATFDRRKNQVVELRIFGGLKVQETAEVMSIAAITVKRDWKLALAWLRRELEI
jgi:RNA polymerase sigma factor (TIGR02999 family)